MRIYPGISGRVEKNIIYFSKQDVDHFFIYLTGATGENIHAYHNIYYNTNKPKVGDQFIRERRLKEMERRKGA